MSYGLYAAAAGMDVEQARVDTFTNNLANTATPGFKRDQVTITSFPDLLSLYRVDSANSAFLGRGAFGPLLEGSSTDFTAGPLKKTGNPMDLALGGDGFFAVAGPGGRTLYTRDGSLAVDAQGYLTTAGGSRVLGTGGPVKVGAGGFTVDAAGTVTAGGTSTKLRLTAFANPGALVKSGANLFTAPANAGARPATDPQVQQGWLEGSNASPIKEMVDMMDAERSYGAGQKMIQAQEEVMKQSDQLGSPA